MTEKTREMIQSEDLEMVNLALTILQQEQPDMIELKSVVKSLLHHRFNVYTYTDIFSGEQRMIVTRGWEEEGYLFVKDPTKLTKLK